MNLPKKNRAKTHLLIAIIFLIGIFLSAIFYGINSTYGAYMVVGFIILSLNFLIMAWIYFELDREYNRIIESEKVIAHWIYSDAEWQAFTQLDYKEEKTKIRKNRKVLFMLVGLFIFTAILSPIVSSEYGILVTYMMIGLIVLIPFASWLIPHIHHQRNLKHKGEAIITSSAIILNGQLHSWMHDNNKFEGLKIHKETIPMIMEIEYSYKEIYRYRKFVTVRIPVPQGKEEEAQEFGRKINWQFGKY